MREASTQAQTMDVIQAAAETTRATGDESPNAKLAPTATANKISAGTAATYRSPERAQQETENESEHRRLVHGDAHRLRSGPGCLDPHVWQFDMYVGSFSGSSNGSGYDVPGRADAREGVRVRDEPAGQSELVSSLWGRWRGDVLGVGAVVAFLLSYLSPALKDGGSFGGYASSFLSPRSEKVPTRQRRTTF